MKIISKTGIFYLIIGMATSGCVTPQPGRIGQGHGCPVTITNAVFRCQWDTLGNDVAQCDIAYAASRQVVAIEFLVQPASSFHDPLPAFTHRTYKIDGQARARSQPLSAGTFGPFGNGSAAVSRVRMVDGTIWTPTIAGVNLAQMDHKL